MCVCENALIKMGIFIQKWCDTTIDSVLKYIKIWSQKSFDYLTHPDWRDLCIRLHAVRFTSATKFFDDRIFFFLNDR